MDPGSLSDSRRFASSTKNSSTALSAPHAKGSGARHSANCASEERGGRGGGGGGSGARRVPGFGRRMGGMAGGKFQQVQKKWPNSHVHHLIHFFCPASSVRERKSFARRGHFLYDATLASAEEPASGEPASTVKRFTPRKNSSWLSRTVSQGFGRLRSRFMRHHQAEQESTKSGHSALKNHPCLHLPTVQNHSAF